MELNVLVDTSVWIDFFNDRDLPHVDLLAKVLRDHTPWTCDLILFEVLSGLRDSNRFAIIHSLFDELPFLEIGGRFLAVEAAQYYRQLRQQGITIRSSIDCFIATAAIRNGMPLLTPDRDFEPFSRRLGLVLVTSL